jgi:hypothetical protein
MAEMFAQRARALVGCRFRPQGRDPDTGLDCVGVILECFGLPADCVRRDYRMRGPHRDRIEGALPQFFRKVSRVKSGTGDVLVLGVADEQVHLAVRTGAGFVHADARLGKVVETPGDPPWAVLSAWRRRVRQVRKGPQWQR